MKRHHAGVAAGVQVRAALYQHRDNRRLGVARRRHVKRRPAGVAAGVRVRAAFDQRPDNRRLGVVLRRHVKRRLAVFGAGVNVRAGFDQHRDNRRPGVAECRPMKRRLAIFFAGVRVRAALDQRRDNRRLGVAPRRPMKRRLAAFGAGVRVRAGGHRGAYLGSGSARHRHEQITRRIGEDGRGRRQRQGERQAGADGKHTGHAAGHRFPRRHRRARFVGSVIRLVSHRVHRPSVRHHAPVSVPRRPGACDGIAAIIPQRAGRPRAVDRRRPGPSGSRPPDGATGRRGLT